MNNNVNKIADDNDLLYLDDALDVSDILPEDVKWKVLIIDDEPEVHNITKLALSDFTFDNRSVEFLSGYSYDDGVKLIDENPDTALIFLDVVMDKDDSGLRLIKYIREVVKNSFVRIVLRTGQPGYAPEEKIIRDYDINDYKEKTELTARKLYSVMISSLRAYRDMMKIEASRKGLEKIIESTASIFELKSLEEFTSGILIQLISLLQMNEAAFYCQHSSFTATKEDQEDFIILAATGNYSNYMFEKVSDVVDKHILDDINKAIEEKSSIYYDDRIVLFFKTEFKSQNIIYLENINKLDDMDKGLIEIFVANVSIAFDNFYLSREIDETQKEIIFALGEIAEARSKETSSHVKRVAEYCKLLAEEYGLSKEDVSNIYIAATMHDVGKLGIPDSILNKPGKLTPDEFEVIKHHSRIGYDMLKNSKRPVMNLASLIALQHHEKFDGTGYPLGLKGQDIHIAGRISAIADVFDALGSERVYKKAWAIEDILELLKKEKGKHFDPDLVEIFFKNLDEFLRIRNHFID